VTEQRCLALGAGMSVRSRRPPTRAITCAGGGKVDLIGRAVRQDVAPVGTRDRATLSTGWHDGLQLQKTHVAGL
jgi:hypothetical protein